MSGILGNGGHLGLGGGGYSHLALAFDYISPHNETSHVGLGIVKGLCQGVVQWIVQQSIQAGLQGTQ